MSGEHMAHDDKLVMMANQIGKFYTPQRQGDPVAGIATHIREILGSPHARGDLPLTSIMAGPAWTSRCARPCSASRTPRYITRPSRPTRW